MIRILAVALALLMAGLTAMPAGAMEFRLLQTGKQRVVLASGDIEQGDARRLAAALNLATRGANGTKQLQLDSLGGVVGEAFAMADLLDQVGVTTIVPAHAICGSACASVLFVSGRYRVVEKGGALAIHSCYDARDGSKMDDCDAVISAHAQYEGVPGLGMMALQEAAGTHAIFVLGGAGAACFGITRAPGARIATAKAPCLDAAMKSARRR